MNKLSLFSGIGGDDLASDWAGIHTVCFVEKDKFCQQVLRKHWHDTPIIEDVKDVTREKIMGYAVRSGLSGQSRRRSGTLSENGYVGNQSRGEGAIDIISGGFPCQPHSVAGKHKGSGDERDLWGEFRRIIGEIKPRWIVAENVPGIFSSDFGQFFRNLLRDLAALGYSAGWCTFGAVDVGAWHRRDRVFIVAHTDAERRHALRNEAGIFEQALRQASPGESCRTNGAYLVADTFSQRGCGWDTSRKYAEDAGELSTSERIGCGKSQSRLGRVADGLSYWLDEPDGIPRVARGIAFRTPRLKCLGNAVVPAQIYPVYKAIVEIEQAVKDGAA